MRHHLGRCEGQAITLPLQLLHTMRPSIRLQRRPAGHNNRTSMNLAVKRRFTHSSRFSRNRCSLPTLQRRHTGAHTAFVHVSHVQAHYNNLRRSTMAIIHKTCLKNVARISNPAITLQRPFFVPSVFQDRNQQIHIHTNICTLLDVVQRHGSISDGLYTADGRPEKLTP